MDEKPSTNEPPTNAELFAAVRHLTTLVVAHYQIAGLALGQCLALTPAQAQRDVINGIYRALANGEGMPTVEAIPASLISPEISRQAGEIVTAEIDRLAAIVGKTQRDMLG